MNWSQFKDPVSHMCLAGAVVAFLSLTQKVAGSSPFTVMTNILSLNSANSLKPFRENSIHLYILLGAKWAEILDSHLDKSALDVCYRPPNFRQF